MSRKTTAFLVLACLVILTGRLQAAGPTYVLQDITSGTVWAKDGSPYVVMKNIVVTSGALLVIQPGVEVKFQSTSPSANVKDSQGPYLVVRGGLRAEGTANEPVSFLPIEPRGLWGGLFFENCDSTQSVLKSCVVKGGRVTCKGCSPLIIESVLSESKRGIDVDANAKPQIMRNRIISNAFGVVLLTDTSSPEISQNLIYRNKYGIYLRGFGDPIIRNNYIYDNLNYDVVNISVKSLSMPNNDFRLADAAGIQKRVYDGKIKPGLGLVNFTPFLTLLAGGTPSDQAVPPAPTPQVETAPAVSETAPPQAAITTAYAAGIAEQYVTPFSLSLDITGGAVITPPYQSGSRPGVSVPEQTLVGFGVAFFGDWRVLRFMSLGLGMQYAYYPNESGWKLASLDAGGRIYPFGPTSAGEFYLQGGIGLNLYRRTLDEYLPGNYHGYAGLGYRFFLEPDGGLDLGLQYDYITPHLNVINGATLKVGWTWLIGK